jgi:hypothetical protein
MAVGRVFLGWDRPLAPAAGARFAGEARSGVLDLGKVVCVVPTARSGRVLLAYLVELAAERGLFMTPPQLAAPGELVEMLRAEPGIGAGAVASAMVWREAVRRCPREEIAALVPVPLGEHDEHALGGIAAMLARAHEELCDAFVSFDEVPQAASLEEPEASRWSAAGCVQRRYLELLATLGLRDAAEARMRAGRAPSAPGGGRVVLVGVPELSPVARKVLLEGGHEVESWIAAPPDRADAFDALGCPDEKAWLAAPCPLDDERIHFADSPEEQADAALWCAAGLGEITPHDVVFVIAQAGLSEVFGLRARSRARLRVHDASGTPGAASPPAMLLEAVGEFLERRDLSSFGTLVRHPDAEAALADGFGRVRSAWLEALDRRVSKSPGVRLPAPGEAGGGDAPARVLAKLDLLLGSAAGSGVGNVRAMGEWAGPMRSLLGAIYAHRTLRDDRGHERLLKESLERTGDFVEDLAKLVGTSAPAGTFAQACRAVAEALSAARIPPDPDPGSVEVVGWVETLFDPSAHAIYVGLNEGVVPAASGPEPLLCEPVRRRLGLAGDSKRLARDAYVFAASCASRRSVSAVCGRRGAEGEPLLPSRILLRGSDGAIAARLLRFATPHEGARKGVRSRVVAAEVSVFPVMPRVEAPVPAAVPITSLRTYVRSPYLFYLSHVLRVREYAEIEDELDPAGFGTLIHDALQRFAASPARHSYDAGEIRNAMLAGLDQAAGELFGDGVEPSVALQIEAARKRLETFAGVQARRRASGWAIAQAEWSPPEGSIAVTIDGEEFTLSGKVDRIDRHSDGRYAIIDYKTSNKPPDPRRVHLTRKGWADFQLPLYEVVARAAGLVREGAPVVHAYASLPMKWQESAVTEAGFTPEEVGDCLTTAAGVLRLIRSGEFWSVGQDPPREGVLATLCGVGLPARREATP